MIEEILEKTWEVIMATAIKASEVPFEDMASWELNPRKSQSKEQHCNKTNHHGSQTQGKEYRVKVGEEMANNVAYK